MGHWGGGWGDGRSWALVFALHRHAGVRVCKELFLYIV